MVFVGIAFAQFVTNDKTDFMLIGTEMACHWIGTSIRQMYDKRANLTRESFYEIQILFVQLNLSLSRSLHKVEQAIDCVITLSKMGVVSCYYARSIIIAMNRITLFAYMQCIPFIGSYMSHINLQLFSYSSLLHSAASCFTNS